MYQYFGSGFFQRKSEEYWPQVAGEKKTFGDATVQTVSVDTFTDYKVTVIHLLKGVSLSLNRIHKWSN